MELDKEYCKLIHKGIRDFGTDNMFSDVTLVVEGKHFHCHRFILSAVSPYFFIMFTSGMKEARENVIQLPFINVSTFELVKHFIYTGENNSSPEEAIGLLEAANFLQIELLQKVCVDIISKSLTRKNAKEVWQVGKKISPPLEKAAFKFISKRIAELIAHGYLLDVDKEDLSELVEIRHLHEDVASELIFSWLAHDFDNRKHFMDEVFPLLRLPFTSAEYLFQQIKNKYPQVVSDERFQPYLIEAERYHNLPARRADFTSNSTRRRSTADFLEVIIVFHLGTPINTFMSAFLVKTLKWCCLRPVPVDLDQYFAACAYGESKLFVSGGTKTPKCILSYSGITNKWFQEGDMFHGRIRHSMVSFGEYVYTFGGDRLNKFNEEKPCLRIIGYGMRKNSTSVQRDTCGMLAKSVYDADAVVSNGRIIIFGKTNKLISENESYTTIIQCYDAALGCTTIIEQEKDIVGLESLFGFDDDLYIIKDEKICRISIDLKTLNGEFGNCSELKRPFVGKKIHDKIVLLGNRKKWPEENSEDTGQDVTKRGNIIYIGSVDRQLYNLCLKLTVRKQFLGFTHS